MCVLWMSCPWGWVELLSLRGGPWRCFTAGAAVFAVDNACPHKGGPLAEGMLVEGRVVCPMHARRYDGITGECDQPGECSVRVHSVTIANGIVRVGIRGDGQDSEGVG